MTEDFFRRQIERLKLRFGTKAFDPEFVRAVAVEVAAIPDEVFIRMVTSLIESRKHTNAPLMVDFREARLAWERNRFTETVKKATNVFTRPLPEIMREHYNVDTKEEAMQIERLKIRIKESK